MGLVAFVLPACMLFIGFVTICGFGHLWYIVEWIPHRYSCPTVYKLLNPNDTIVKSRRSYDSFSTQFSLYIQSIYGI